MEYYVQLVPTSSGLAEQFWAIDGSIAHLNISPSPLGTHKAEPGEDVLTTIKRRFPQSQFHRLDLGLGQYFPRMARPGSTRPDQSPGTNPDPSPDALHTKIISTGQLHALIQELQAICRVVHPCKANAQVYGHEIRNLLIIASTEVEAQWKSILLANHVKANSRDKYVKLSPAMKLTEYEVALPWFPWLGTLKPFQGWVPVPRGAKQHLPWYDAYNEVKHDREGAFEQATLEHTLQAMAACFVMLCAQYGWQFARRSDEAGDAFFQLVGTPIWQPNEIYLFGGTPTSKDHPF